MAVVVYLVPNCYFYLGIRYIYIVHTKLHASPKTNPWNNLNNQFPSYVCMHALISSILIISYYLSSENKIGLYTISIFPSYQGKFRNNYLSGEKNGGGGMNPLWCYVPNFAKKWGKRLHAFRVRPFSSHVHCRRRPGELCSIRRKSFIAFVKYHLTIWLGCPL